MQQIICDICHQPIKLIKTDGLFGTRCTIDVGILGRSVQADICFDCQQKIIKAAKSKGEVK